MDFKEYINYEEFETKKIEFKEIVSHKNYEKWLKEIAAFANTDGGKVFFGVDDDENPIGLTREQVKNEILYINDMCDKKLHPHVRFDYNKIKIEEELYILEVIVFRNDNTPVWMTRSDEQDVIYIRREGQSVIAHGEQVEELVLSSKRKPFDTQFTNRNYFEFSFDGLQELYQERHNNQLFITLKQLESIDAIDSNQNVSNGLMLFADNCDYENCNIACRVWPGLNKGSSTMLDKKEYKGSIPQILDYAKKYIKLYTKTGLVKQDAGGNKPLLAYPERAIEEALINAVAHRDYNIDGTQIDIDIFIDRIRIASPGSFLLPGRAQDYSMEEIPSKRRNTIICEILKLCNMMESSGSGFEKIISDYKMYPKEYQPKIYSDPAQFVITLCDLTYDKKESSVLIQKEIKNDFTFSSPRGGNREYDRKILEFCMNEPKSRQEIQNHIDLSNRSHFVESILNPLLNSELLLTTKDSPNAPNQKYYTNKEKIKYN